MATVQQTGSDPSTIVQLVVVAALVIGLFIRLYLRQFSFGRFFNKGSANLADSQEESAIIAFFTAGRTLANVGRGEMNGMAYSTYVTMPDDAITARSAETEFVGGMVAINVLDLPFNTATHLVGLSKKHKVDRVKFENFILANGMEKVELEGDFQDYFDLYAAKDQQLEAREVMNPKSMAFVVDYCRTHFWEINQAELYFAASSSDKGTDNIFQDSVQFVNEIRPALQPGDPGAPVVHHAVPYGEYDGPPLKCPICGKPMASNKLWHTCPNGHGILITGRELEGLDDGTINIDVDPAKSADHQQLICPNCHNRMNLVGYQGGKIQIDSCSNCPFRWLDAADIAAIKSKKPLDDDAMQTTY